MNKYVKYILLFIGSFLSSTLLYVLTSIFYMYCDGGFSPMGRGLILIVVACLFYSPLFILPILAQMIGYYFTRHGIISATLGALIFSVLYVIAIKLDYIEDWLFLPGLVSQFISSIFLNLNLGKFFNVNNRA